MTGTELKSRRKAEEAGLEAIVPTRILPEWSGRRWREREIVMLPGYVFVLFNGTVADYYKLTAIPDAIRILPGKGVYSPVPSSQMTWILKLAGSGQAWGVSTAIRTDGKIRVLSGPLSGRESLIRRWDRRRRRAKICVKILDHPRLIEVGLVDAETNSL